MKISMVHFSDIHFREKDSENHLIQKSEKIISAIKANTSKNSQIICLMNGDVAFKGHQDEYFHAYTFFEDLRDKVRKDSNIDTIFVPGNHDCDFTKQSPQVREALIQKVYDSTALGLESGYIESVMLQDNFYDFEKNFSEQWENIKVIHTTPICKQVHFYIKEYDNKYINLFLFNTSWMSQINEQPGKMFMPTDYIDSLEYDSKAILNISILHHPTNWLDPDNKRSFDNILNKISDLVMTGHEHVNETLTLKKTSQSTLFLEGGVLQENWEEGKSEFNLLELDLENLFMFIKQFSWDAQKKMYVPLKEAEKIDLNDFRYQKVKFNGSGEIRINEGIQKKLLSLDFPISHKIKGPLSLNDIYVLPDFNDKFSEKKKSKIIGYTKIHESMMNTEHKVILIEGAKETGKTSFLQHSFIDLYKKHFIPLLLEGAKINSSFLKNLDFKLKDIITSQYSAENLETIHQSDSSKRILLIDNWNDLKINSNGKSELLREMQNYFSKIVITTDNVGSSTTDFLDISGNIIGEFNVYELRKMGFKKREELIEKWIRMGSEYDKEESDILIQVDEYARIINGIVGKNYIPQVPMYILVILQSLDNGSTMKDFQNKTNGYYYELLIRQLISDVGVSSNDIATLDNYLIILASKIFHKDSKTMSEEDWIDFHRSYVKDYEISKSQLKFMDYQSKLLKSNIIRLLPDGNYTFGYNYLFYYYVAQYLSSNINKEKVKKEIEYLIKTSHYNLHANILIFLVHLSKDEFILNAVVQEAQSILGNSKELKLEEDIGDLNALIEELPRLVVESVSAVENRKKVNENRDKSSSLNEEKDFLHNESSLNNEEDDLSIIIDKAIKISEIIGQILRNYSGSILGELKRELLSSAFSVSLKAGNEMIEVIKSNQNSLIKFIETQLTEEEFVKNKNHKEIENTAKKIVFTFIEVVIYAVIQKVINDTATPALEESYTKIRDSKPTIAVELIIAGSTLETSYKSPVGTFIEDLHGDLEGNLLAKSILNRMIGKYMYLFDINSSVMQSISSKFNINYNKIKLDKNRLKLTNHN